MFLKHLAVFTAVLAIGVASCSGPPGTTVQDPLPHGTGLTTTGAAVTGTGVSGITSTVTITGSGNVNAAESSTPPGSAPAIQNVARASGTTTQSVKPEAATANTALVYLSITASAAATITGFPSSSFTFSNAPTGSVFLAYFNPATSAWQTIGSAGTVSGNTVTFGAVTFSPSISLAAGASMFIAVYTGAVIVAPTPSPTPSPSPTASPSPGASPQAIVNGGFEASSTSLSPWYPCFANHQPSGPVDDNLPIPPNEDATPIPASSPTPGATTSPDLTAFAVATSVPSGTPGGTGTAPVHGGANAALVGHSALVSGSVKRGKGNIGLCQDITVPSFHPMLTMWVFEGGNYSSLYSNDVESEIYPAGSFTSSGPSGATAMSTTTAPSKILFLEDNCYDNLNKPTSFAPPMADCLPPSGAAVQGGVWKQKGPYDLTAYAGQAMTLFIGIMGTSTSTTFYGYAYYDDVSLTGTLTQSVSRGGQPQSVQLLR